MTAKRTPHASGRTRPDSERRAEGKHRVAVWLDPEDMRLLEELEAQDPGAGSRVRAIRMAIRMAAKAIAVVRNAVDSH